MAEPYTGLYSAPLRLALRYLDEKVLRLFIALCSYADERGVCFPGLRELAATTGFSVELVSELLYQLEARGLMVYIRKNERDPATKRQLPNVYMLSNVLYVARTPVEGTPFPSIDAIVKEKPDRKLPLTPIHNQNHKIKDQEPHQEPALEVTPQPPNAPAKVAESGLEAGQESQDKDRDKSEGRAGQPQTSQRSEPAKQPLPPFPPSREPDDLRRYNTPLEPNGERLAQEIRAQASNMTNANARMLVDIYGVPNARAALILYGLQPKNSIPNPAGYIRALLRKHAVTAEDVEATEPDGKRYVSGEYAQFIEH